MKYATIRVHQSERVRHPMHQFIVETAGFHETRLVGSLVTGNEHTAIFHVEGWPPGPYEQALKGIDTVESSVISEHSDASFSVYIHERLGASDREIVSTFGRAGLVTIYPVRYDTDGSLELTLVGPSAVLQEALDETPTETEIEVLELGDYDSRRVGDRPRLTDRQHEAVTAAVDCGYYETPSECSVETVAESMACAPSTAAEHLRRAERKIMTSIA